MQIQRELLKSVIIRKKKEDFEHYDLLISTNINSEGWRAICPKYSPWVIDLGMQKLGISINNGSYTITKFLTVKAELRSTEEGNVELYFDDDCIYIILKTIFQQIKNEVNFTIYFD